MILIYCYFSYQYNNRLDHPQKKKRGVKKDNNIIDR